MSTATFSEIAASWYPRETEASILAQLLRLSRLTVLHGEAGAGKTALLKNGVLPRLRRRASDRDFTVATESPKELPFPDRRQTYAAAERAPEVAIFFDEWDEAPLAGLDARMRGALRARRARTADTAASMAKSLRAWNKELGVRFLIIFDAFDEYLAASRDAPGIRKFGAEFVEALEDDRLPANFLLALRDERPLVERFEGRIACLGDTSVRLPSWHRFVGSPHENEHRAGPPAAAAPDLGDATAPALRPIPESGLHTITGVSRLLEGVSLVLDAAPKSEVQTVRTTPEVGGSSSPVLEVVAFDLGQSVATAEPESNPRTAPRVPELADRATPEVGESPIPVLEVTAEPESNPRTAPRVPEPADRANAVRRHWGVKLGWLALPLIGIALLLIVLATPKRPSEVADVPTKPESEVVNVPTNPKPPSEVTRTPAATETRPVLPVMGGARSTGAETAVGVPEIARLMARANALLAQQDIASARIVLERAVDLGSAKAAFALAETYDPIVLDAWRTFGTRGDVARAKQLYAKARAGGVQEAQDRLNALRQ